MFVRKKNFLAIEVQLLFYWTSFRRVLYFDLDHNYSILDYTAAIDQFYDALESFAMITY